MPIINNEMPKHIYTWKHNSSVNDITVKQLLRIKPKNVFDIGVGDGFYGKLLCYLFDDINVIGIEKNPIYIGEFDLKKVYNVIIIDDIMNVISKINGDLIIFGDVLEHLEKHDMINVLRTAVNNFGYIIINSPLGFQPQDHEYEEEIHRCGIERKDFKDYKVLEFVIYDGIMFNCLIEGKSK